MLEGVLARVGGLELFREADFGSYVADLILGGETWFLQGVFCDFVAKVDGKLWSFCGELHGECGLLAATILAPKNTPRF